MNLPSLVEKEPQIPPIIAVDFDGTLVEDKFPDIGEQKLSTWYAVENWRKENPDGKVILWTCRTGQTLKSAVDYCAERGLHFDAINDNIDEVKIRYGENARKVYANAYWDDRAVYID